MNSGQLRQLLEEKLFVRFYVCGNDSQQKVDIAKYDIAIEYFRVLTNGGREVRQIATPMRGKLNVRENHGIETDFFSVEFHGLVMNHPGFA